ncbi:MAG: UDP-N-acetylmuramoyl-tripeptide--D-alanyl-D-alanine ligase [Myxococcota bacterium]
MISFRATDAVHWSGGELRRGTGDECFSGVSIDTRTVEPGQLFVAIRGPSHDAHAFLDEALGRGAAGLLIERGTELPPDRGAAVVEVKDTTVALGALAAGHRESFLGPLVAITGSNGKTTTKEMCAAILGVAAPCLKNPGNLNNEYGLPLTLLARGEEHRSVVVEIGMNHRGEIAPLAAIARPTVGVITNVGTAHIEHLGSRDEIALEKGDLVAALGSEATAILNADDPRVLSQRERSVARVVTFGVAEEADVRAERVTPLGDRGHAFDLVTGEGRLSVHVAGIGDTAIPNALAAAAASLAAGASVSDVAEGLARYRPVGGRMEQMALPRNIIIINDTYNANPQSMEVALRSLARLKGEARGVAVLGDMGELGGSAPDAHREVGRLVAELGVDLLFVLGDHAREIQEAALAAGMDPGQVCRGEDHESLGRSVREILQGNDWVLVKGSRSMRMERVVLALTREEKS